MRNLLMLILLMVFVVAAGLAENWPHWRGPSKDGVSRDVSLPVSWGAKCVSGARQGNAGAGALSAPVVPLVNSLVSQGRRGGFGEGRPLTPLACSNFEETNISWKLRLP